MRNIETLEPRRLLSGVTLITHGQGGDAGGEVAQIADLIAERAGGAAQYVLTVENEGGVRVASFTRDAGSPEIGDVSTGEMIIKLDWGDANAVPTPSIAAAVADFLVANRLVEQELHLAGPSRGASVVSNLAASLGERGVWVDHVTYIDPVPAGNVVPGLGDFVDGPMRVTENVVFADNYWRSDNNLTSGFDGQPVDGAHNVSLNTTVQVNNAGDPHVGAGLYYISTVEPTGPLAPGARSGWFGGANPDRDETGFVFSRIAGGQRPAGGVGIAYGGTAERDSVDESGPQWANVAAVALRGNVTSVPDGQSISVGFRFGDADSKSTVSIYLDRDRNPYNGNTVSRLARRTYGATPNAAARLGGSTVEATPGTYYVYAQINDGSRHTRYAYAPRALQITTPPASMLFVSKAGNVVTVSGTNDDDRLYVVSNGTSLTATRHDFSQTVSLANVTGLTIDAKDGDDTLVLGSGVMGSLLLGGGGSDTLIGADFNDNLQGGGGRDRLFGGGGQDRLSGGGHNDYLDAGSGADRLYGDAGNDILLGGSSNDRLYGGSGSDTLDGGGGTDIAHDSTLDLFRNIP